MQRGVLTLLLVFLLGAAGGMWSQAFLLPALASNPALQSWQFLKDWNARTQVLAPIEQVYVRENEGVERVIEQVRGTVVGVRSAGARPGSGLVYTSDGLIVTLASLVPAGWQIQVYLENQEPVLAQAVKRDFENNLALLKVEDTGLRTAGFVGNGGVKLGERVILLAKLIEQGESSVLVNQGIVKKVGEDTLATSILEEGYVDGAPLFDVEGRVAGLADADFQGNVFAVSSTTLRIFLGF